LSKPDEFFLKFNHQFYNYKTRTSFKYLTMLAALLKISTNVEV